MPKEVGDNLDILDLRWPNTSDRAFVETGPFRGAWAAKATDERLYRMIKGFREAGDMIVDQGIANHHRSLNLLYPAIFNYRQALELQLKYLLMAYGPLVNEAPDFKNHGLLKLWEKCRRIFFAIDTEANHSEDAFRAVDAVIAEFDSIDPRSDVFRFAHDTKGQSIQIPVSEIDLPNLREVMAGLHNFLGCIDCHLRYTCGATPCQH